MVEALKDKEKNAESIYRSIKIDVPKIIERGLEGMISKETANFFEKLEIDVNWLNINLPLWTKNTEYLEGQKIVRSLQVVNDVAERGISLIPEYANLLTKDENLKECVLQVVSEYRKLYPDARKSTIMAAVENF
ncbi:hypothetical protein RF55_16568 [Lasius niger]|uniref:Uncharacterized protein n=1 Tax=Lasius niger TaxID=67767 RepID=A0A0J7K3W4_LASNI|nr:hypothetical protein RF55_16568 [Lasius niger]